MSARIKIDRKGLNAAIEAMACFTSYDTPSTLAEDCIRAYLAALSTEPGEAEGMDLATFEIASLASGNKVLILDRDWWPSLPVGKYHLQAIPAAPIPKEYPIMASKLTEIEQALRAGMDAASKGAWQEGAGWVFIDPIDPERNPTHALRNLLRDVPDEELQANVKHIVAAQPENIRALLDELSRLRTRIAELEAPPREIPRQPFDEITWDDPPRVLSEREGQE